MKQLKDVRPIIKMILAERDKNPLMINQERYLPNWKPNQFGNAVRGGLRKALRIIEQAPVVDAVEVVRCCECIYRKNELYCPMCYEEYVHDENDGGDWVMHDRTKDQGFCHVGKRDVKK